MPGILNKVWKGGIDGRASEEEIEEIHKRPSFPFRLSESSFHGHKTFKSLPTLISSQALAESTEPVKVESLGGGPLNVESIGEKPQTFVEQLKVESLGQEQSSKQNFNQDENVERGNWGGRLDFILSCIGYAVGLGNVWRFPYLCYRNGGGIFFIPYILMLVFVGMPVFFLELALAQFCSSGPLTCWKFSPFFSGIGVSMVIISTVASIYYNLIIALSLFYLFASMTDELPWTTCPPERSSELCSLRITNKNISYCTEKGWTANHADGFCYNNDSMKAAIFNKTASDIVGLKKKLPAEEYFNYVAFGVGRSDGIGDIGQFNWKLALCLLLAWTIVFLVLIKGVKSSGKVVYFTATFPYFVLIIFLVKGATLDGHLDGIQFYLNPKFERLIDARVWKDAAVQIFFSLSSSWGGLIALASYNRFHNDCLRDALITSIVNCLTSFFAGFVVFSYMGYLAKQLKMKIEDVASDGFGLAFIVYPEAFKTLQAPPFWSCLFFIMLLTLGLDSQFAYVETIMTALHDRWPALRVHKIPTVLIYCLSCCLIGLIMCTDAGAYILQLLDTFSGGWNVLLIAIMECVAIGWVYGTDRFREDIKVMLGETFCNCLRWSTASKWWELCWKFFTPFMVTCVMIFSWVDYEHLTYEERYTYPLWAESIGWCLLISTIVAMFTPGIVLVYRCPGTSIKERVRKVLDPTIDWGPALVKHRKLIHHVEDFQVCPWSTEEIVYRDPNKEPSVSKLDIISKTSPTDAKSMMNKEEEHQNDEKLKELPLKTN